MDLFGFVDLAADMGLDGVELTSYYFPADVDTDYLHRLKQHAFMLGLDVSGTSVGNNFCLPDGPERDKQLALVRTWVDRAAELDAPVIRIFAGDVPKGTTEDEAVARAVEGIKASLPYAAEKGVTLALENHGGITATPGADPQAGQGGRRPRTSASTSTPATSTAKTPTPSSPSSPLTPSTSRSRPRSAARAGRRKRPTSPRSSASSATPSIRATSSSNTRPPKTR